MKSIHDIVDQVVLESDESAGEREARLRREGEAHRDNLRKFRRAGDTGEYHEPESISHLEVKNLPDELKLAHLVHGSNHDHLQDEGFTLHSAIPAGHGHLPIVFYTHPYKNHTDSSGEKARMLLRSELHIVKQMVPHLIKATDEKGNEYNIEARKPSTVKKVTYDLVHPNHPDALVPHHSYPNLEALASGWTMENEKAHNTLLSKGYRTHSHGSKVEAYMHSDFPGHMVTMSWNTSPHQLSHWLHRAGPSTFKYKDDPAHVKHNSYDFVKHFPAGTKISHVHNYFTSGDYNKSSIEHIIQHTSPTSSIRVTRKK